LFGGLVRSPPRGKTKRIAIGPVTGGWLVEHFDWHAVFLVNLPIVVIALVGGRALVPESRDPGARPLDPIGAGLSIAGLTALVWAIIEAPDKGWDSTGILVAFAAAIVLLVAFAAWELRARVPMLDVRLFRNRRFSAASLSVTMVFFALMGMIYFLTQYLQYVLGYDAFETGLGIAPVAVGVMVGAGASSRLVGHFGAKVAVASGLGLVAGGLVLLSTAQVDTGYGLVAATLVILGLGMGTAMTPATDSVMGSLPLDHASVGSAVNDTTRQVGGALGVAVLGSLLSSGYRAGMESGVQGLPDSAANVARDSVGGAMEVAARLGGSAGRALVDVAQSSFVSGMHTAVLVGAGVALIGALVALVFLPSDAVGRSAEPVLEGAPA
jgi:EmrB/QacA subfamily drug resistance transporter